MHDGLRAPARKSVRGSSGKSGKKRSRRTAAAGRKRAAVAGSKRASGRRFFGTRVRRWLRAFRRAPGAVRIVGGLVIVLMLSVTINGIYQVARKPSELFFPVSGTLFKTPAETWRSYAPIFRIHSTRAITPELLAALAQQEGAGNPVARTYWRWSWSMRPFEMYRPASSSVGMYQMTDGTFAEARNYCIHDHAVVRQGPWDDLHSCWLNGLYFRVLPSHAVELTSAYLDMHVTSALARNRIMGASLQQTQHLAAVIHLCGAAAGDLYARRGFRFSEGQRCGTHDPRIYIAGVDALRSEFSRLAAQE